MSLSRLIELAKKTGDTLIVHDPVHERDMVVLGVETYEQLLGNSAHNQLKKTLNSKEFFESIKQQIVDWSEDQSVFEQQMFWSLFQNLHKKSKEQINDKAQPEHNWHSIADVLGYEQQYAQKSLEEQQYGEDIPPYQPPEELLEPKQSQGEVSLKAKEPDDPQVVPLESVESPRQDDQELTYEIPVEQEPLAEHIPAMPPLQSNSQARARMHEGLNQYKQIDDQIKGNIPRSAQETDTFEPPQPLQNQPNSTPPIFFDEPV